MNDVGGLNDNGVIAHALLPAKMDSLYFMPSNRGLRLPYKVYTRFCRWLKTEKHELIAGVSASLPFSVLSQRGCFKSFCNAEFKFKVHTSCSVCAL